MTVSAERKQEILRCAIRLILLDGLGSLTIRKIAEAAGISPGLVLYHFESKERLITEAWKMALSNLGQRIVSSGASFEGRDWMRATFRVRFLERDETSVPWLFWLEYWTHAARNPGLRLDHSESYAEMRIRDLQRISRALQEGDLRRDLDPLLVADMFHTLVCGLIVKAVLDTETISAERAFQVGEFFLSLISPGPTTDSA